MFNTSDAQTVANGMRGNYSMAEKLLMANAGVQNSDPAIRARINGDQRAVQNADKSFTDRILGANAPAWRSGPTAWLLGAVTLEAPWVLPCRQGLPP